MLRKLFGRQGRDTDRFAFLGRTAGMQLRLVPNPHGDRFLPESHRGRPHHVEEILSKDECERFYCVGERGIGGITIEGLVRLAHFLQRPIELFEDEDGAGCMFSSIGVTVPSKDPTTMSNTELRRLREEISSRSSKLGFLSLRDGTFSEYGKIAI